MLREWLRRLRLVIVEREPGESTPEAEWGAAFSTNWNTSTTAVRAIRDRLAADLEAGR